MVRLLRHRKLGQVFISRKARGPLWHKLSYDPCHENDPLKPAKSRKRFGKAVISHPGLPAIPPTTKEIPRKTRANVPHSVSSRGPTTPMTTNVLMPNKILVSRPKNKGLRCIGSSCPTLLRSSLPGRRGISRSPVPLRTVRDSFPSYGSSLPKGHPYGTPRLYHLVQMAKTRNSRAESAGRRRVCRFFRRRKKYIPYSGR